MGKHCKWKFIKEAQKEKVYYDAVLIDEAHRLFRDYRKGIASSWVGIYEGDYKECKLKGSAVGCYDVNTRFKKEDYDNNPAWCEQEFTLFILNCYYILLTRGIDAVRVGFWKDNGNSSLLEYMKKLWICRLSNSK